ncbi:MAG: hypothetical protein C0404_03330 [Verrucomicrobia bacterium]|nr:hypothetical protein [Verrucomicrobiota bacterium]
MDRNRSFQCARLFLLQCALLCLSVLVLGGGCASSRSVLFTSAPPGARVAIGEREYPTPCWGEVYGQDRSAKFTWPDGQVRTVDIPAAPAYAVTTARHLGSTVCKVVGTPLLVGGVVLTSGILGNIKGNGPLVLGSTGAVVVGGILCWGAKELSPAKYEEPFVITGTCAARSSKDDKSGGRNGANTVEEEPVAKARGPADAAWTPGQKTVSRTTADGHLIWSVQISEAVAAVEEQDGAWTVTTVTDRKYGLDIATGMVLWTK